MPILQADTDTITSRAEQFIAEATAIKMLDAELLDATDIGTHAIAWALQGVQVFSLRGKTPAIPSAHPAGDPLRGACKGDCGRHGHGVLDATTDLPTIVAWWSGRYAGHNIGGRVPANIVVVDVDPRSGGDESLAALERQHGRMPDAFGEISGRGDGGRHYWFRAPAGPLSSSRLGRGIDIKTHSGYVVLPPSIHPDTGRPYEKVDGPITPPPAWLAGLLLPEQPKPSTSTRAMTPATARTAHDFFNTGTGTGLSIEKFNENTSWRDVLEPHGWRPVGGDGDADGARWLHPTATSSTSASVRGGRLYIYTPNTDFDVTEASDPHGYSKFDAHAVLNHRGDMKAAARQLAGKAAA
ncbi:bifunctional DNA primase/polymerase [Mycolicibacterium gilvum]|uniref:Bifunctional DNA primase/polymerase famiily protein n=1 Tax=Mycolicibacterium gilvum (strain DSM 45189 / LMG 24558 / Spyr1) TaxID=278137 RepID=E6TH06_MYCSR|nr:bifunctional DNA primase/polymerase [Mycolicibacterium gilvum]ADT97886.1 bifunctional DNA primase/polymerase famiily protein [Mycolicibacterium gilvum Spyr1]